MAKVDAETRVGVNNTKKPEAKAGTDSNGKQKKKMRKGGRNLVIMGMVSILIAMITTGVSLAIYHKSGDIYLDRSRPGFLPDEEEAEQEEKKEEDYDFAKNGPLTATILQEYLDKLQVEVNAVDAYDKPFDAKVLSDKALGIPEE